MSLEFVWLLVENNFRKSLQIKNILQAFATLPQKFGRKRNKELR